MIRYRRNKGKRALAALLSAALTCAFLPAAVFGEALEEPESEDLPGVAIEDDSASMSRDNAEIEEKTVAQNHSCHRQNGARAERL